MKLEVLDIHFETTLEEFAHDWRLNIDEIKEGLDSEDYYISPSDYWEFHKDDDGSVYVEIFRYHDMIVDDMNNIYDQQYVLFQKEIWGMWDDEKEQEIIYTIWTIIGTTYDETYMFFGHQRDLKRICTEEEKEQYETLMLDDLLEHDPSLKEYMFVKEEDFNKEKWYETPMIGLDLEKYTF